VLYPLSYEGGGYGNSKGPLAEFGIALGGYARLARGRAMTPCDPIDMCPIDLMYGGSVLVAPMFCLRDLMC